MQLTGAFDEFSWHDLLELIGDRQLTGWLCIEACADSTARRRQYQVWFNQGCIVAATQSSRRTNGLLWLMQHQGWLSYNIGQKLAQQCPAQTALGRYFRQQGALDDRQLHRLFNLQLVPVLKSISQLAAAQFQLDTTLPLPLEQMTGLSLTAYDAQTLARRSPQRQQQTVAC